MSDSEDENPSHNSRRTRNVRHMNPKQSHTKQVKMKKYIDDMVTKCNPALSRDEKKDVYNNSHRLIKNGNDYYVETKYVNNEGKIVIKSYKCTEKIDSDTIKGFNELEKIKVLPGESLHESLVRQYDFNNSDGYMLVDDVSKHGANIHRPYNPEFFDTLSDNPSHFHGLKRPVSRLSALSNNQFGFGISLNRFLKTSNELLKQKNPDINKVRFHLKQLKIIENNL